MLGGGGRVVSEMWTGVSIMQNDCEYKQHSHGSYTRSMHARCVCVFVPHFVRSYQRRSLSLSVAIIHETCTSAHAYRAFGHTEDETAHTHTLCAFVRADVLSGQPAPQRL